MCGQFFDGRDASNVDRIFSDIMHIISCMRTQLTNAAVVKIKEDSERGRMES